MLRLLFPINNKNSHVTNSKSENLPQPMYNLAFLTWKFPAKKEPHTLTGIRLFLQHGLSLPSYFFSERSVFRLPGADRLCNPHEIRLPGSEFAGIGFFLQSREDGSKLEYLF